MRISTSLAVLTLAITVSGCSQTSVNTLAPTTDMSAGATEHRIGDIDDAAGLPCNPAGPDPCPDPNPADLFQGLLTLTASSTAVSGPTGGVYLGTPRQFQSVIAPPAPGNPPREWAGKFAGSRAWIGLNVQPTVAELIVSVEAQASSGGGVTDRQPGIPSFTVSANASCTSGLQIETRATFQMSHLGKTTVIERHCQKP